MLKQLENLSDERVVEQWVRNPSVQVFCGERFFQWKFPCDPSDLTYFRRRLGESEVVVDTTVQEKNSTFPTYTRLHTKRVIKCARIAKKADIKLRRSYKKELRACLRTLCFHRSPKNARAHRKAKQRIKTLAGAIFWDVQRKRPHDMRAQYAEDFVIINW